MLVSPERQKREQRRGSRPTSRSTDEGDEGKDERFEKEIAEMLNPFTPGGNTVAMAISTSSESDPLTRGGTVRIYNLGPNKVFVAFGGSAIASAIPVEDTPANGIPIASGASHIWDVGVSTHIAAICAATESATIYMTSGTGGVSD